MAKDGKRDRAREAQPTGSVPLNGAVLVGVACALVLFQGGYYPGSANAVLFVGIVMLAVLTALYRAKMAFSATTALLAAMGAVYLVSSLAHGSSLDMLQDSATWFSLAGLSLWCSFDSPRDKAWTLECLSTAGVVLAAAGLLMYAGVLPVPGSVNTGRLMFTFQYANTAGLFFAVAAVLCLCGKGRVRRALSVVPIAALLLTQSGGALVVFGLAVVALGVRWAVRERPGAAVVAGVGAGAVALAAVAAVALRGRAAEAAQTFIERVVQMVDSSSALVANPLLGLGPNQWQYAYPSLQTAQYHAADVHCSYLQAGVDAGVVALGLLVAFVVLLIVRLAARREWAPLVCAAMIALHALVDLDFQFSSMLVLLVVLAAEAGGRGQVLCGGAQVQGAGTRDARAGGARGRKARTRDARVQVAERPTADSPAVFVACSCLVAVALVSSAGAVYLDLRAGAVQSAAAAGDATVARELLESDDVVRRDKLLQIAAVGALYDEGRLAEALELADSLGTGIGNLGLYRAYCLYGLDRPEESLAVVSEMLDAYPYDVELYQAVRQFITDNDPGEAFVNAHDDAADRANRLAHEGHAAWLSKQDDIEQIGG